MLITKQSNSIAQKLSSQTYLEMDEKVKEPVTIKHYSKKHTLGVTILRVVFFELWQPSTN
jgi:hypothetical protein